MLRRIDVVIVITTNHDVLFDCCFVSVVRDVICDNVCLSH